MIHFNNIKDHVVPIGDFRLKWRFTEKNYNVLPTIHLSQLMPLNPQAAKFLWDLISDIELHQDMPFKHGYFKIVKQIEKTESNHDVIKKWLFKRGIPFQREVFLSWSPDDAMIVPWKLVVKYFDDFFYPGDDLTVIDESLLWSVLFYHQDIIYFGRK